MTIPRTLAAVSTVVVLIALLSALLPATAEAQTTSRRSFRSQNSSAGLQANCWLRARSDTNSNENRRYFAARPSHFDLTVSAVQGLVVTNAGVDTTLDAASTMLQGAQQPPADVACCLALLRSGNVGSFPPSNTMVGGVVSTQAEQNYVLNINADLKFVSAISFCGQAGSYAGCAGSGTLMVSNGTGGATYAHEVGHREGLCHTGTNCNPTCGQAGTCSGCGDPSSNDIMYYRTCGANQNILSAAECVTYRQDTTP